MRIHTQNKSTTTASLLLAEQPSHWEAVRRRAFVASVLEAYPRNRKANVELDFWTCDKFLSFNYSGLDVVKNSYPVCRNFCRFLLAYGLGHILFVSLENGFKFSTILGSVSISKQLNRDCGNREQESDQDCRKVR